MLQGRVRGADGAYVLAPDDAYLEMVHELLRRGGATASDAARLAGLAERGGHPVPDLTDLATVAFELDGHMARRGYELSRSRPANHGAGP
jgi:hypothetical protein